MVLNVFFVTGNDLWYLAQASPYLIEVYAEKCSPSLKVSNIDLGGKILKNAVIDMVMKKVVTI